MSRQLGWRDVAMRQVGVLLLGCGTLFFLSAFLLSLVYLFFYPGDKLGEWASTALVFGLIAAICGYATWRLRRSRNRPD
jgi:uncharacterized membrane protein YqjE